MNQRISIRAIVKKDNKILLLRRATGRESILGKYELPGGRVQYLEQPEDALRRILHEDAGIHTQTVQLYDAVTYIDRDDRDIQYIIITYVASVGESSHDMRLSQHYNKYVWQTQSFIQQENITDLTQLLLGVIHQDRITDETVKSVIQKDVDHTTDTYIIHSDGGSRGNPGPSAAGFVIKNQAGTIVASGGDFIGDTSNNVAEYFGVLFALQKAQELEIKNIEFYSDSSMVVNQLNGVYKIKNRELWPINEQIREILKRFQKVSFRHVNREFNQAADAMVNKILDEEEDKVRYNKERTDH